MEKVKKVIATVTLVGTLGLLAGQYSVFANEIRNKEEYGNVYRIANSVGTNTTNNNKNNNNKNNNNKNNNNKNNNNNNGNSTAKDYGNSTAKDYYTGNSIETDNKNNNNNNGNSTAKDYGNSTYQDYYTGNVIENENNNNNNNGNSTAEDYGNSVETNGTNVETVKKEGVTISSTDTQKEITAKNISMSDEAFKRYIQELYNRVLDRIASEEELVNHLDSFKKGTDIHSIVKSIIFSKESIERNGELTNYEFTYNLYIYLFNRNPDQDGLDNHVNYLEASNSRDNLIINFCNSLEFTNYIKNIEKKIEAQNKTQAQLAAEENALKLYVKYFYENILNVQITNEVLIQKVEEIKNTSISIVTYNIIVSEEFKNKYGDLTDNEEFVRKLYNWILRREPDEAGLETHIAYLERKNTRQSLVTKFCDSEEFQKLINKLIVEAATIAAEEAEKEALESSPEESVEKNQQAEDAKLALEEAKKNEQEVNTTSILDWVAEESELSVIGDLNGDKLVNAMDASIVLQIAAYTGANSISLKEEYDYVIEYGDVNRDGHVNTNDASIILMYAADRAVGNIDSSTDIIKYYENLEV